MRNVSSTTGQSGSMTELLSDSERIEMDFSLNYISFFFFFFFFFFYSVPMKQYIPQVHTISTHTNIVLLMHCIMNI